MGKNSVEIQGLHDHMRQVQDAIALLEMREAFEELGRADGTIGETQEVDEFLLPPPSWVRNLVEVRSAKDIQRVAPGNQDSSLCIITKVQPSSTKDRERSLVYPSPQTCPLPKVLSPD